MLTHIDLQASMIPSSLLPPGGKLDMFAVHTRFHRQELSKVLHQDSVYVTVVRDPPRLFESLYSYFYMHHAFHMSLEKYIDLPLEVSERMFKLKLRS